MTTPTGKRSQRLQPAGVLVLSMVGAIGCANAAEPKQAPTQPPKQAPTQPPKQAPKQAPTKASSANMTQPTLNWELAHTKDKRLRIDFSGTNPLSEVLYVCDKIVIVKALDNYTTTDAPVVLNSRDRGRPAGVVEVLLAQTSSNRPSTRTFSPTYRPVAPGADFSGSVYVPFPLVSWHPLGGTDPIKPNPTKLVFKLVYMIGEPPSWTTKPSEEGPPIKVPQPHEGMGIFPTAPKLIPSK